MYVSQKQLMDHVNNWNQLAIVPQIAEIELEEHYFEKIGSNSLVINSGCLPRYYPSIFCHVDSNPSNKYLKPEFWLDASSFIIEDIRRRADIHENKYDTCDNFNALNYQISVKVMDELSSVLYKRREAKSSTVNEIMKMEKELDIELKPVHPESNDPMISSYFIVEVNDKSKAEQVIKSLRNCPMIESASIKPGDELPSASI